MFLLSLQPAMEKNMKKINNGFVSSNVKKILIRSPLIGNDSNKKHVAVFRRILEISMTQGRWSGFVPLIS